jgi:hypothetical protein
MPAVDIRAREKNLCACRSGDRWFVGWVKARTPPKTRKRRTTMDTTFDAIAQTATTARGTTATTASAPSGRAALWTGRVLSGLSVAFMTFDGAMKVARIAPVVKATAELGYPISTIVPIGITLLACVALYLIPRTAILGAVLLTGYLGGAVATHVRVGDPLLSHVLFPIYVAALTWGGLYLRDRRTRALLARRAA